MLVLKTRVEKSTVGSNPTFSSNSTWRVNMTKTSKFVRVVRDGQIVVVFVPATILWKDRSQTRDQWLNKYFGVGCLSVSRDTWLSLSKKHEVKFLIEENGKYREEEY